MGQQGSERTAMKREAEDTALPPEKKTKSYRGCRHCKSAAIHTLHPPTTPAR
jgi:hypothetical protein